MLQWECWGMCYLQTRKVCVASGSVSCWSDKTRSHAVLCIVECLHVALNLLTTLTEYPHNLFLKSI